MTEQQEWIVAWLTAGALIDAEIDRLQAQKGKDV